MALNPRKPRVKKPAPPYFDVQWEPADVSALQALRRGEAEPDQQKRALDWIIKHACNAYQPTFHPGQPDASAFAEGRRWPGLKIVELLTVSTRDLLDKQGTHNHE